MRNILYKIQWYGKKFVYGTAELIGAACAIVVGSVFIIVSVILGLAPIFIGVILAAACLKYLGVI